MLDRRIAASEANPGSGIPWEVVTKAESSKRLGREPEERRAVVRGYRYYNVLYREGSDRSGVDFPHESRSENLA